MIPSCGACMSRPSGRLLSKPWTALEATGCIRNGRLEIHNRKAFSASLRRLRDGEVLVSVRRTRAARSQHQNRWYWGVIVELISEHTGYTPDEIHELLKAKFIPKRLTFTDGNGEIQGEFVIGGSTARLDKVAFGEYCEAIRTWSEGTLGLVIPDPDAGTLWPGAKQQRWAEPRSVQNVGG